MALLPSDFGMHKVGYDSGDESGDGGREPKQIVIFDNKIRENSI